MALDEEKSSPTRDFDAAILPDLLPIYYKRLFPYSLFYRWMSYGNVEKSYFINREFSFTLADDVYLRYQSFSDQFEFEKEVIKKCPHKMDIGAVYNYKPSQHRSVTVFQPLEKELVFDIDMTDYDEVRTCCSSADICCKCWPFMTIAMKILDRALREDFGYEHLLWVYSGRRGIHCWVCDESARKLPAPARSAVAEYLQLIKGGEYKTKKVELTGTSLHPSIRHACNIIQQHFDDLIVEKQGLFDNEATLKNILELCPDKNIKEELEKNVFAYSDGEQRWKEFKEVVQKAVNKGQLKKGYFLIEEIMLQLCYPRLDINVTKGLNHLLKAPFCIHPKTGRVCVPVDVNDVDRFNPFDVPTISQLCEEIDAYDAKYKAEETEFKETGSARKKLKEYKKTSLVSSVSILENFVQDLEETWKGVLLEKSDMAGDF